MKLFERKNNKYWGCDCPDDFWIITKKVFTNGQQNYRYRCANCGKTQSTYLIHKYVEKVCELENTNVNSLPDDADYDEIWMEFRNNGWEKRMEENKKEWQRQYRQYLQLTEWKLKRWRILLRDNNRCQICKLTADRVHHLTYDNVQLVDGRLECNEKDEDLVSLCERCHDKIHNRSSMTYEEIRRWTSNIQDQIRSQKETRQGEINISRTITEPTVQVL